MSGVYPYCILPAGRVPDAELTGVDRAPVQGQGVGPFTVWVSSLDAAPTLDLERVEQHHEVVRAAARAGTPVPVRFGAWAPSAEALSQRILPRAEELQSVMAAVSGRVEYGVLILDRSAAPGARPGEEATRGEAKPATDDAPARREGPAGDEAPASGKEPASGRDHLRALARERAESRSRKQRGEELARRLRAHLGSLPVEERVTPTRPPGLVAVAHLVARSDRDLYLERVESFARDRADMYEARVTGPWPPYSFTER